MKGVERMRDEVSLRREKGGWEEGLQKRFVRKRTSSNKKQIKRRREI